jgi:GINS complex subunit 4
VRSFLRARISKVVFCLLPLFPASSNPTFQIDAHALYYLSSASARARLSPSEAEYSTTHQSLLSTHYASSFLSQFPVALQRLDDTAGGIAMVEQPDFDKAVFVRALVNSDIPVQVPGTDIDFELRRGGVYVVRWNAVRDRVEGGEMELV